MFTNFTYKSFFFSSENRLKLHLLTINFDFILFFLEISLKDQIWPYHVFRLFYIFYSMHFFYNKFVIKILNT